MSAETISTRQRVAPALRILLVIESSGGGSARHVADLAAGLSELGHQVEVAFSPRRADSWFVEELESLPLAGLHRLHMQRNPGPEDIKSVRELRALLLRRGPFDVIHGHSAKAGALVRLAGMGLPGKKLYTPHAFITLDPELARARRLLYTVAERLLGRLADGIICVSMEEQLHARQELGLDPGRLFTVENGLQKLPPADRPGARAQLVLLPDDVCVGFVGRISSQKAVTRLIRAFAALYARCPQLVLAIVGDGPDLPAIKDLARQLQIDTRVRFMGAAEGVALMSGFDLFALASNYEAFPYVYLEALARGMPIVTTRVGGATAVVDAGVNGYVVPQDNPAELERCIELLANDAELRARMSRASLHKSESRTLSAMVVNTLTVYKQLLQRKA